MESDSKIVCPVCLKSNNPVQVEIWRTYKLLCCDYCDVIFSHPFTAPGAEWYEKDKSYKTTRFSMKIYWHHEQFLMQPILGNKLLDVGCNNGVFLSIAEKMGYVVTGLDFNRNSIESGQQAFGLKKLYSYTVEDFSKEFPSEKFDVITCFEILEHLDNPNQFLKTIKGLLRPQGSIAISVPNRDMAVNSLGEYDYPPHHLTKWSDKALAHFLNSHGFSIIAHKVKEVDPEDLATWFDHNIMKKLDYFIRNKLKNMAITDLEKNWQIGDIKLVPFAVRLKNVELKFLTAMFLPLAILLRLMGKKGFGQYVLARLAQP